MELFPYFSTIHKFPSRSERYVAQPLPHPNVGKGLPSNEAQVRALSKLPWKLTVNSLTNRARDIGQDRQQRWEWGLVSSIGHMQRALRGRTRGGDDNAAIFYRDGVFRTNIANERERVLTTFLSLKTLNPILLAAVESNGLQCGHIRQTMSPPTRNN